MAKELKITGSNGVVKTYLQDSSGVTPLTVSKVSNTSIITISNVSVTVPDNKTVLLNYTVQQDQQTDNKLTELLNTEIGSDSILEKDGVKHYESPFLPLLRSELFQAKVNIIDGYYFTFCDADKYIVYDKNNGVANNTDSPLYYNVPNIYYKEGSIPEECKKPCFLFRFYDKDKNIKLSFIIPLTKHSSLNYNNNTYYSYNANAFQGKVQNTYGDYKYPEYQFLLNNTLNIQSFDFCLIDLEQFMEHVEEYGFNVEDIKEKVYNL